MQGYVTIKEASKLTGKHPDTIRRYWKVNGKVDEGLKAKYTTTGKGGVLLINKKLLELELEAPEVPTATEQPRVDNQTIPAEQNSIQAVIEALTNQLSAKDKQIDQLQQIVLEKEANTTKLQDQFQRLLASQQLPATASSVYEQQPAEAYETPAPEPMQTEVKPAQAMPKRKPAAKKKTATKQAKNPTKQGKKPATKTKPAPAKPTKPEKKKRWWGRS